MLAALAHVRKGIEWRAAKAYRQLSDGLYSRCMYRLAFLHRRLLRRTVFIAITGSAGKTTTKDLVSRVLERHLFRVRKSSGTANRTVDLASLVLGTRRSETYCVTEIAILTPGYIDLSLALVRPAVGIVTNIGSDHVSAFGNLDAIAAEKSKLIRSLPPNGIAVLNADDPRVLAMRSQFSGRVVTYGLGADAMLRGEAVKSSWPDRLSLTVKYKDQSADVQTKLCGAHWVPAVLAALATGVALGIPLAVAAEAVASVEPYEGRMSPVETDDGVTFIRDDWKAPLWTIAPTLEFVRQARAARKIIVIGTVSDYSGDSARRYVQIARQALTVADCVIFVGRWASSSLRAKRSPNENLCGFATLRDASTYLSGYLKPGDLVLLKGSTRTDHLERLILVRTIGVECWRSACGRAHYCNECNLLHVASGADEKAASVKVAPAAAESRAMEVASSTPTRSTVVVVGLGNPGGRYVGTPHNVGQCVVDILAQRLTGTWTRHGDLAMIVRTSWEQRPICLVKLLTEMNDAGPTLFRLAQEHRFSVEECILVHDDLDLPVGTVRTRLRGGAGGHQGLQSIVLTFQNDRARRVKIGVGRPPPGIPTLDYVLTPLSPADRPTIDAACRSGADRVLELIRQVSA